MSAIVTYALSQHDHKCEIDGIQFGIMSKEEIRRLAVVECDEVSIYTKGVPTPRGVLDHRMGTVDRRLICGTCNNDLRTCPGHWGKIELPVPILHIAFLETIRKTLNCICYSCSRLRLTESEICNLPPIPEGVTQRKQRLSVIYGICRNRKSCPYCSSPCPIVVRHCGVFLEADWANIDDDSFCSKEEKKFMTRSLNPIIIEDILSSITDEDIIHLGLDPQGSHPKNMVMNVLLVPPPVIRPSIMVSEGSRARGQDDLTLRLMEIVKKSNQLRECIDEEYGNKIPEDITNPIVMEAWEKLAVEISFYIHNNPRGARVSTQRSGIPTKCLLGRLKGKQGRFRSNLMGKRVNYSGRSVISPDPLLDVDEVGVPEYMALQLTIQERVTETNIDELSMRVVRGHGRIDGAETVITTDGTPINLEYCTNKENLLIENGWIVERPLQTGDWVLFNRQPTLHRSSLMGHRVVIMPGKTLRCNLAVVSPYNADFDGDEMNIHVPQSPAATSEVRGLMSVTEQVVSPQASKPVMGIVQDALLGAHLLTSPDILLTAQEFMSIVSVAKKKKCSLLERTSMPPPTYTHPKKLWTGKQLVESILPGISLVSGKIEDIWEDDDIVSPPAVVIRNGRFICGQFTKATLGATPGGVLHVVLTSMGNKQAIEFMGDIQRISNRWLLENGFSVGIGDCVPSRHCDEKMRTGIDQTLRRIDAMLDEVPQFSSATLNDSDSGKVSLEKIAVERTIHRMVSRVQMSTGSLVKGEMRQGNGLGSMVTAGSKGNSINICQILCCVGQNCVNGERISRDGSDDRTLPSYPHGDMSIDGGGFVSNSYILGLTATESFFHAKGGREGLVDTAVKTSKTGYIQRRLVKGMESHRAEHDFSVRDAANNIIEFVYGCDGMNPAKLERTDISPITYGDSKMEALCIGNNSNIQQKELEGILSARNEARKGRRHVLRTKLLPNCDLPVNSRRVLNSIADQDNTGRKITHSKVFDDVEKLVSEFPLPPEATANLRFSLRYDLRSARVVDEHNLSCHQWQNVLDSIREAILESFIEAGEMVGSIAAQSIGEPATQMTLNSVDWNTTMAINWTGREPPPAPPTAEVGAFIDALIEKYPDKCEIQPDGVTVYLPLPPDTAMALSPDEDGNMKWTTLEAVTRHPPINKDGTNTLVKVTTESGREVIVTKGKSLLVEKEGKLVEMDGDKVNIGDKVPIVQELPEMEGGDVLDLHTVFKETEIIFTDVTIAAKKEWEADIPKWFDNYKDRSVYKSAVTMKGSVKKKPDVLIPGKVFWKHGGSPLPSEIPLDREFGFFVGAYLAEGCVAEHQVHISNIDEDYRKAAAEWPLRHSINHHTTSKKHQSKNNGTSISIMFHSKLLVQLLERTCGKLSAGKRVPGFAFAAPTIFVEGLLDGYFSGDGCIRDSSITCNSRSKMLRDGIATLLARFGIASKLSERDMLNHVKWTSEDDGTYFTQEKYGELTPMYEIRINKTMTMNFAKNIHVTIGYKQEVLDKVLKSPPKSPKLYSTLNTVRLEEITSLEEVSSSHEFVYDLTVEETRNMATTSGFCPKDTFHLAGVAMEGRSQLSGIPRVSEIIDASKNIKTECMRLRIGNDEIRDDLQKSEVYARSLEYCILQLVVSGYDMEIIPPGEFSTKYHEDNLMISVDNICDPPVEPCARSVLRMVLNQRLLKRRGLTPISVLKIIMDNFEGKVQGIASPPESLQWVIRVRAIDVESDQDAAKVYSTIMQCHIGGKMQIELAELVNMPIIEEDPETKELRQTTELGIETAGSALGIVAWEKELDWYKCTSNDIMDVYNTLGIAAARTVIFHELRNLVAGDSSKVNDRHIMMVAKTMTHYGSVMPMSRHGINRQAATGPLLRCSFEETSEVLTDAGIYSERDTMRGISQTIMMGKRAYVGTGCSDVLRVKGTSPFVDDPAIDGGKGSRLLPGAKFVVGKSTFRGSPISPRITGVNNSHLSAIFASRQDSCEPPYADAFVTKSCTSMETDLWEMNEPTETEISLQEEDENSVRLKLLDVISRVPFEPPQSPRLVIKM